MELVFILTVLALFLLAFVLLIVLYKWLLRRGIRNQALFEAYLQYRFSPKHTIGEQLLGVRRDKRERAAFAAAHGVDRNLGEDEKEDEDDQYQEDQGPSLVDLEELDESTED